MIRNDYGSASLPLLGFGCMRFPVIKGGTPADIDYAQTEEMIRYAMDKGVNYFDTAYPYHNGMSETVLGKILSQYPRESYFLADKFPGHQVSTTYDPKAVFEHQLKKCQTEYFDFYLLHNVFENSLPVYLDPKWGIMDYFIEQKKQGRIRHLGFSSHGSIEVMEKFLDLYGEHIEFCQIQLNYLDWTLQNAKDKVAFLRERGVDIWVMEPVRGGKLATLSDTAKEKLAAYRPDHSPAAWAFRFLQDIPGVKMILSGMSNFDQVKENIDTFEDKAPLTEKERELLLDIAETLKSSVPCTACGYCVKGCPMELDIPFLLSIYNDLQVVKTFNTSMRIEFLPEKKKPHNCISCGACSTICPQKIKIPETLNKLNEIMKEMPSWAKISKEREEIANREREANNQ
ncbi:MAG: 4Fe-4S dicluster domain-containing protein [Ruminococcaceae bacterium]|nr:4Fe-4S dicluster domain-containing protein [Oscillospiraceae bacterium]